MTVQTEEELDPSEVPAEQLKIAKKMLEVLVSSLPKPPTPEELAQEQQEREAETERIRLLDEENRQGRAAHMDAQKEAARKHDLSLAISARQATALERIAYALERIAAK